jgi:hypothetical protein
MAKTYSRMAGVGGVKTSTVNTSSLRMSLDTNTGDLSGEIIAGPHAGSILSDLALDDLTGLLAHYQKTDAQSARVLTAFLDRHHPDWRDSAGPGTAGSAGDSGQASSETIDGEMTRDQALAILGLEEGAAAADIKAAHHRLIAALHPDRGGSSILAAQVNRAKDLLLGK